MYQALYRKWRPRTFDDVVGQSHITDTLKNQVIADRLSHAYLFTGTRGTGKTTCAKIFARAVNCEHPENGNPCNHCASCLGIESEAILDVLELDAASNNGVDQVRALRDEAVYTPAAVKKRVYIIDEVHMLSTAAFNALLKILEEPPSHLMFILATTELHKVPATIKSRCQQFSFKRITSSDIIKQLQFVSKKENVQLTEEGAFLLARLADGGLRDALSLLDLCIGGRSQLGESDILDVLGLAGNLEISKLMEFISGQDTSGALQQIHSLYQNGKDMTALLGELSVLLRDLLIWETAKKSRDSLLSGNYEDSTLRLFANKITAPELFQMLTIVQTALTELYRSSNQRTDVELCVIHLCEKQLISTSESLLARMSRIEEQLSSDQPVPPKNIISKKDSKGEPLVVPSSSPETPVHLAQPSPPEKFSCPTAETSTGSSEALSPLSSHEDWNSFVLRLKNKIPPSAYTFLGKASFASGNFDSQNLTIFVDSEMTKTILSKGDVLPIIGSEAALYANRPLCIQFTVGKREETFVQATEDKLDDLLKLGKQFENITIK